MSSGDFRHKAAHIPVAREGIPYILAAMFVTLITAILGYALPTLPLLAVTLLVGHFFRDPERIVMAEDSDILSPADGSVIAIKKVNASPFFEKPCVKISIFMSVFDVHVNRIPCTGIVRAVKYNKGRFLAANFTQASVENEQSSVWIESDSGHDLAMTQVAGLIARRIVCWPRGGDRVLQGERFGMIRFGSRMDVYAPEGCQVLVSQGQHVYGGETVLCKLR